MKKNETDFGQYEIMDRTYCIIEQIEIQIMQHNGLTINQQKKLIKALNLLDDVYQSAGKKAFK